MKDDTTSQVTDQICETPQLGFLDRFLTLWILEIIFSSFFICSGPGLSPPVAHDFMIFAIQL